ncbi:MAG: nucleoside deaminase [Candidatus Omnitrophica bacterium]|nr:nucleoside deaminase [Candidatus Omnitrophota bacterium]
MIEYMILAIEEAKKGIDSFHGGPFGAVIVKGDEIIAKAHNTVLLTKDPTKHAEMNAISEASRKLKNFDLSGCSIYSTTEPCPMCFSAIHWAKIDKIYFGTTIEDVAKLGFNELAVSNETLKKLGDLKVELINATMKKECRELLSYWKGLSNKGTY